MEQLQDFTELDFVSALERLPIVREDGLERLMFAGLSLAAAELEDGDESCAGVFQGAGAFVAGVLLAISLRGGAATDVDRIWLSGGAAEIKARGRHAVIAAHCDLRAVAVVERAYAHELASEIAGLSDEDADRLRSALVRLFEGGLALGLLG